MKMKIKFSLDFDVRSRKAKIYIYIYVQDIIPKMLPATLCIVYIPHNLAYKTLYDSLFGGEGGDRATFEN